MGPPPSEEEEKQIMKIEFKVRDDEARRLLYFLRAHYNSKAGLNVLAKRAAREVAAVRAAKESGEAEAMCEGPE